MIFISSSLLFGRSNRWILSSGEKYFLLKVRRDARDVSAAGTNQYDYLTIVCWRKMAEYASKYYTPGMLVEVYGTIRTGLRTPKGYKFFKENGDASDDFFIPRFEIYARRVVVL